MNRACPSFEEGMAALGKQQEGQELDQLDDAIEVPGHACRNEHTVLGSEREDAPPTTRACRPCWNS